MEKNHIIQFGQLQELLDFATALSSPLRMEILRELSANSKSVKEIAFKLNIPMSTASANIKILEDADIIRTSYQSGKHGSMKLCSIKYEKMIVELIKPVEKDTGNRYIIDMPIGGYFDVNVTPTCGIVDENGFIGKDDDIRTFLNPDRFQAQLLWFTSGYLEYRFPLNFGNGQIENVEFSLELCSEAPGYRNEFPSDITFCINDIEICEWTSPGDFGGVRGAYSPPWWPINSTQYGTLKKVSVNRSGSYLDDKYVKAVTLRQLGLEKKDYISFKVGVKPTAHNVGGINIFGKKFGNYEQNILMTIEYKTKRDGDSF